TADAIRASSETSGWSSFSESKFACGRCGTLPRKLEGRRTGGDLPDFFDGQKSLWRPINGRKQLFSYECHVAPNGYRLFSAVKPMVKRGCAADATADFSTC
ncbi:MAG: hypothetical protein KA790_14745, partial [Ottowia sp.]|nr:hypothetical protein [Ottowia sp.]